MRYWSSRIPATIGEPAETMFLIGSASRAARQSRRPAKNGGGRASLVTARGTELNAPQVWRKGVDPRGTLVETYLMGRALTLPRDIAGEVIRFHGACPWLTKTRALLCVSLRCSR